MMRAWPLAVAMLLQAAPAPQTTFRARIDQVLVDVVVTDRHDRPVTNLTAADFEIVENGRAQKITDVQFVSIPVSTTPLDADMDASPEGLRHRPEGLRHHADLTFGVTGASGIPSRTIPLSAITAGNRREAIFESTLPLQHLAPGDYVLQLEARLPDGQTAQRNVPFAVR